MRIGLLRHFPVQHPYPTGWITSAQLKDWREAYDGAAVTTGPIELGGHTWDRCWSSDLGRAYCTAQAAFQGDIVQTPLLREPEYEPFGTGRLPLPLLGWRLLLWATWLCGHRSQRASRDDFRKRVRLVADQMEADQLDTLLVGHAGFMAYFRRELLRRGFRGPQFRYPENAKLYVFEKPGSAGRTRRR